MGSPQASARSVRFGVFEADLRSGELSRNGVKVRIQELPFRALSVLLSSPGEVISRDELRRALWREDVFVEFDQGISSAIRRLREALGDSADDPTFIETVGRRGYRWIAPISFSPPDSEAIKKQEEEEAARIENHPVAAPLSPKPSLWRTLVFVPPVLTLLFAVWIFRPGYRDAKAGMKSTASATSPPSALHHATNREAEDYYLKGRFYWNKRTPESLSLAVDAFTQAIVHDPGYAEAYVGLADCYNLMREYTLMPGSEAYQRAGAAAKKAVELDDNSSEAHASLAFVSFFGMWDAGTADEEFRRAIDLDPNNAKARHWYATFLQSVRRFDESLEEIGRAQSLDPNSASILADKGILLWRAGKREPALRLLRQLEQTDPNFVSPHRYLRIADLEMGDYPGYLSEMKKEDQLLHNTSLLAVEDAAEKGFATHGAREMLRGQLDQQKKLYSKGELSPFYLAETYSQMGNAEEALKYLQASYDRHDQEIIDSAVDPAFNNLRSIPAFQQLLAKVGLPSTN
jgi:DNA-binding winged helix-turn-helix (wHTH) protein/Flp pilus assembly protein TadD